MRAEEPVLRAGGQEPRAPIVARSRVPFGFRPRWVAGYALQRSAPRSVSIQGVERQLPLAERRIKSRKGPLGRRGRRFESSRPEHFREFRCSSGFQQKRHHAVNPAAFLALLSGSHQPRTKPRLDHRRFGHFCRPWKNGDDFEAVASQPVGNNVACARHDQRVHRNPVTFVTPTVSIPGARSIP
jgi:hypothetical protein